MKTVAIFVDIANLYYCVDRKWKGKRLDYTKFTRSLVGDNILYKAIGYGLQYNEECTPFITFLKHLGYEPKYKRPRIYRDPDTGAATQRRTSWSMGMAMDIVTAVITNKVDEIFIGSSDGDLAACIKWVQARGVKVTIFSCGLSQELKRACPNCVELTEDFLHEAAATA